MCFVIDSCEFFHVVVHLNVYVITGVFIEWDRDQPNYYERNQFCGVIDAKDTSRGMNIEKYFKLVHLQWCLYTRQSEQFSIFKQHFGGKFHVHLVIILTVIVASWTSFSLTQQTPFMLRINYLSFYSFMPGFRYQDEYCKAPDSRGDKTYGHLCEIRECLIPLGFTFFQDLNYVFETDSDNLVDKILMSHSYF